MDGYIHLSRDEDAHACGILEDASYPKLGTSMQLGNHGSGSAKDCGGGTAVFDTREYSPKF